MAGSRAGTAAVSPGCRPSRRASFVDPVRHLGRGRRRLNSTMSSGFRPAADGGHRAASATAARGPGRCSIRSISSTADGPNSRHAATASRAACSVAKCGTSSPRYFGSGTSASSASATTARVPSLPTRRGTSECGERAERSRRGPSASRTVVTGSASRPPLAQTRQVVPAHLPHDLRGTGRRSRRRGRRTTRAAVRYASPSRVRSSHLRSNSFAVSGPNSAARAVGQDRAAGTRT